jgi:tripartite-type tricarboxylate transporter receptor subunit TctC
VNTLSRRFAQFAAIACACVGAFSAASVAAQTYPSKPVKMIVPFEPGGATDILARLLSAELTTLLGQQFVVENRSGAGGNIGSNLVAKGAPDGYLLLFGAAGNIAINPSLFKNMPYDPVSDLTAIAPMASTMNVLVVNPNVSAKSVTELINLAKQQPGKLTFASSGNGSTIHLSGEMFKMMAGIDILHVPYRGSAPAMVDLVGGRTDMMIDNLPSALPRIQSGALRALGVTASARSKALPDTPTIAEAGLPGFEATSWFGVFAPAKTPQSVIDTLNKGISEALRVPAVLARIQTMGAEPMLMTSDAFGQLIRSDIDKWRKVIKAAGVSVD